MIRHFLSWRAWPVIPVASAPCAALLLLAGCADAPATHAPTRPMQSTAMTIAPDAQQCLADLGQRQANFTPLRNQYFGAGCATVNTVRLAWLRGDDSHLELSNLGPVTCQLATTLSGWARFGVDRAARTILGSPLARIETFGSYNCRNVAGTDHRSAHATANALDVSGFLLADGRRITITSGWNGGDMQTRAFLRTVRDSACKRFGVVLTPDYNIAHHDHLHLEVGARYPVCH